MAQVKVASLAKLKEQVVMKVAANGKEIALYFADGNVYATDNTCPHENGPLGEGFLEGKIITCPMHGWQFDVRTGRHAFMPGIKVPTFKVEIKNGDVLVDI
ncbi:MAG: non-heme iron oxygenase ferredoxin subunit [Candidatus Aenigmarchaeota archaeon]|nr:non-heme iron oxygenase ferredoxin subunit [Candidatus Aenigmarchaeota archaeon]